MAIITVTQRVFCVPHRSKAFTCVGSFNPPNTPVRSLLSLILSYR